MAHPLRLFSRKKTKTVRPPESTLEAKEESEKRAEATTEFSEEAREKVLAELVILR